MKHKKKLPVNSKKFHFFLLLIILILGAFLRFYNTPDRYSMGDDSTRDALVAIAGAKDLQFPLTGPFSSLGPFTFGPWYYYQLILFSLLPIDYAPWIYMGIISVLFIYVMYKIGEELNGKYFGLIAALFTALSPPNILAGVGLSNPNMIPLYSGLSLLLFIKIIKKDRSYWLSFLFGIFLGIGISIHYQMSGLLILLVILLAYKPKKYHYFLTAILGFSLTFIPMLLFDMNNHWYTLKNMYYYYTEGKKSIYVPNRWLFYLRDFWPAFWSYVLGLPHIIGVTLLIISFFSFAWLFIKRRLNITIIFLSIAFAVNFILLRYYWGERGFGYLQFLYPFIFIYLSLFIWFLSKLRYGVAISLMMIIFLVICIAPTTNQKLQVDRFEANLLKERTVLNQKYANQKLILYNCTNLRTTRAQAYTTAFWYEKKIDITGKKIGILQGDCPLPKNRLTNDMNATEAAKTLDTLYSKDEFSINITTASDEAILKAGWVPITPNSVFTSVARWWLTEQP